MPPSTRNRLRRIAFGLSVVTTTLRLTACFVSPNPTNPHVSEDPDPDEDRSLDPPDASADASEDSP